MSVAAPTGLSPVREVLPNGAVALLQRTATHPAVAVVVGLPAGSGYDPPALSGVSHFVSRVIDRGTERLDADAIAEALDGRGVALGTSVTRHTFSLSVTCLAEDLEPVLEVLADIVMRPTFAQAEVETRRGEIATAIRQDEDNPAAVAGERLMELLYPDGHPYGRPSRGTLETVAAIDRQALVSFHRARFTPAGLQIVIVGDAPVEAMLASAARAFGEWRGPHAELLAPPPAPGPASRELVIVPMMSKVQVDLAYGLTTVTRADPDYHALVLMNTVLGQYGLGGRLGDSIRERQGMAYYAFSSFDANVAEGPFVVRAGVAPEHVDRTIASIDEEIHRMLASGVSASELADARRYLVGSMPRVLETNDGIASFLQSVELFGLGLDYDRRLPMLLEAVTREDVLRAARRVLHPERAAIVIAGPYADPR